MRPRLADLFQNTKLSSKIRYLHNGDCGQYEVHLYKMRKPKRQELIKIVVDLIKLLK